MVSWQHVESYWHIDRDRLCDRAGRHLVRSDTSWAGPNRIAAPHEYAAASARLDRRCRDGGCLACGHLVRSIPAGTAALPSVQAELMDEAETKSPSPNGKGLLRAPIVCKRWRTAGAS